MSLRMSLLLLLFLGVITRVCAYPSLEWRRIDSGQEGAYEDEGGKIESHIILVEDLAPYDDRRASYVNRRRNRLQDLREFYPNASEKDLIMMLLSRPVKRVVSRRSIYQQQRPSLVRSSRAFF
eukprot:TRINITY_DN7501_c0_g1_i1.p1 TRINITY_DN7501_c0_g1~~TRINITY_DN7501_c0_g1_i1.p1  ORF type:complete len:123 (+),score=7.66 TRINITY_DN7501_c0_g1_i1:104-472(+)